MDAVARWWDGVELWIAGLSFVPQVAVVLLAVVPLAALVAYLLDLVLAAVVGVRDRISTRGDTGQAPRATAAPAEPDRSET